MTADSCLALEHVAVHETRRRQQWVVLMFGSKGRKCHLLRCRDVDMQLIDEILEYLQYHPMSSRQDVEGCQ